MSAFQFTDANQTAVFRSLPNNCMESYSVIAQEYLDWIKAGNTTLPAAIVPPQPNVAGFIQALKTVIGLTKIAATPMLSNYATWVFNALAIGQWTDAQTLIITANTTLIISPTEYAAIKSAVTQFNLPMTLP